MDGLSGADRRRCAPDNPVGASFRDPAGTLFPLQGRILRIVNSSGVEDLTAFLGSQTGRTLIEAGHVVGTRVLDAAQARKLLVDPAVRTLFERAEGRFFVEHERIAFPSFPYEWPPASLILVHWPVPHLPHPVGLHNGSTSERNGDYREEYFANLALSDRTLGELRRAMERAGLWERTVVLITSDHALRNEIWGDRARGAAMTAGGRPLPLVPFLLKLPGQDRPLEYSGSFNTVLSHELILALLRGELSSPESALRWLDQNRARFPIS